MEQLETADEDRVLASHRIVIVGGGFGGLYGDQPLPGVALIAMQEGAYIAKLIQARLQGRELPSFHYSDVGSLAVIGQNAAVVNLGWLKLSGFLAWLIWVFAYIYYLIEFDNKLIVMLQ